MDKLATNIVHFGRTLRAAGLPVGPGRVLRAAHRCLLIWFGFVVSAWSAGGANAQANLICGKLEFRAAPDQTWSSGGWFQVFRRAKEAESPVLPRIPWVSVPKASCVGSSVLVVASFAMNGDPYVHLVFQDGDHTSSLLSLDAYELQGDAIILPARPRLDEEIRARIPEQYRDLFDYGPLKGKFG